MKTVKLTICNKADVLDDMRIFSSIVRVAFNRYQDGLEEKEVRSYCNERFNHNSWFIQSAIKEAASLYKLNGDKSILFGGKNNLRQYMCGLIDKDTFKYRRMFPIGIQGEKLHRGNRLFMLDLENQRLTYKPSKEMHVEIRFLPMKKKIAEELSKVQELAEQNKITVSVKLSEKYVWLTYDEGLIYDAMYKKLQSRRLLGIDMGCHTSFTLSTGEEVDVKVKEPEHLKRLQRKQNRQKKGSNSRRRTIHKIQKKHQRLVNRKNDMANKIVADLNSRFGLIYIQDENLKGWHKDGHGKAVQHSCLGRVKAKLKSQDNVYVVNR